MTKNIKTGFVAGKILSKKTDMIVRRVPFRSPHFYLSDTHNQIEFYYLTLSCTSSTLVKIQRKHLKENDKKR